MYFTLMAHLSSYLVHTKCLIASCGWSPLHWSAQMEMLTDEANGRRRIGRLGLMDSLYSGQSSPSQPCTQTWQQRVGGGGGRLCLRNGMNAHNIIHHINKSKENK